MSMIQFIVHNVLVLSCHHYQMQLFTKSITYMVGIHIAYCSIDQSKGVKKNISLLINLTEIHVVIPFAQMASRFK